MNWHSRGAHVKSSHFQEKKKEGTENFTSCPVAPKKTKKHKIQYLVLTNNEKHICRVCVACRLLYRRGDMGRQWIVQHLSFLLYSVTVSCSMYVYMDSSRVPRRHPYFILNRHTLSSESRVYRVTQNTDGVHCRESAGTGPVNLKVIPNECCLGRSL